MAQSDLSRFLAKNHQKLLAELQRTKAKRAQTVSARAKPLLNELRAFYQVDDDMKALKPYLQQDVETGPPGSGEAQRYTLALGGVQTTQTVFGNRIGGMERGTLEGAIASLARLGSAYTEVSDPGQDTGGSDAA
jgi:hypothetical protein